MKKSIKNFDFYLFIQIIENKIKKSKNDKSSVKNMILFIIGVVLTCFHK